MAEAWEDTISAYKQAHQSRHLEGLAKSGSECLFSQTLTYLWLGSQGLAP